MFSLYYTCLDSFQSFHNQVFWKKKKRTPFSPQQPHFTLPPYNVPITTSGTGTILAEEPKPNSCRGTQTQYFPACGVMTLLTTHLLKCCHGFSLSHLFPPSLPLLCPLQPHFDSLFPAPSIFSSILFLALFSSPLTYSPV